MVEDNKQAEKELEDTKGKSSAPAVVFTDQNGKKVAHNPGTLRDESKE